LTAKSRGEKCQPYVEGGGRSVTLFFAGSVKPLKPSMDCPLQDEHASCNVRKAVIAQWGDREGYHLYNHSTPDYHKEMVGAHFCLGVSGVGGGWGRRHTLAAMHGCIPVMIMDGSSLELEELIPWWGCTQLRVPLSPMQLLLSPMQLLLSPMQLLLSTR
jgi:hypothetical protein